MVAAGRLTRKNKRSPILSFRNHQTKRKMKRIFPLFVIAFVLVSCNNPTQQTKRSTDNEKLVQQYFEYFNKHDFVKMANMYAETADFKDPSLGAGIVKQTR